MLNEEETHAIHAVETGARPVDTERTLTPTERIQESASTAWVRALAVVNSADLAANCFGGLQGNPRPRDMMLAARSARTRLVRVLVDVAYALAACGRVEALASVAEKDVGG